MIDLAWHNSSRRRDRKWALSETGMILSAQFLKPTVVVCLTLVSLSFFNTFLALWSLLQVLKWLISLYGKNQSPYVSTRLYPVGLPVPSPISSTIRVQTLTSLLYLAYIWQMPSETFVLLLPLLKQLSHLFTCQRLAIYPASRVHFETTSFHVQHIQSLFPCFTFCS